MYTHQRELFNKTTLIRLIELFKAAFEDSNKIINIKMPKTDRVICPSCSKDYSCRRGLKKHLLSVHKLESIDQNF